jgi:hypothetical protein
VVVTEFACERVRDAAGSETKLQISLSYALATRQGGATEIPGHELDVII